LNSILHTIDTAGPGGAETICLALASGLDVARFRSCAAIPQAGWLYDAMMARHVDAAIVPGSRGSFAVGYLIRMAAYARAHRVTLIQSHLLTTSLYCGLIARALRVPAVATFHGAVDVATSDRWAMLKLRLICANSSRIVFVSESLRRHFKLEFSVSDDQTAVIPNGIDASVFRPKASRRLRQQLGLPDDAFVVAAVGNVRAAKGYDDLLRVAAVLRDHQPTIQFIVAGDTKDPTYDRLIARRRELNLVDRVKFLGFREDVAEVLNGADLYLSTSTSEGFSLTTVQAMACGLAVIATRSGGPEEIISNNMDGVLVSVGDTSTLAHAITELAQSRFHRQRLGDAARATVLRRFTIERMITAYEDLYQAELSKAPAQVPRA